MHKGTRVMHERSALQEEGEMQERCAEARNVKYAQKSQSVEIAQS